MTLYESEYYRIGLDRRVPCIEWIGLKKMDSDTFRESEIRLVEFYKRNCRKYPSLQLFVDARVVGNISAEDTSWVASEILPQLAAAGLEKDAFLVPASALEKLIVKNFINKAGDTIEMKVFSTEKEAKRWIKS